MLISCSRQAQAKSARDYHKGSNNLIATARWATFRASRRFSRLYFLWADHGVSKRRETKAKDVFVYLTGKQLKKTVKGAGKGGCNSPHACTLLYSWPRSNI